MIRHGSSAALGVQKKPETSLAANATVILGLYGDNGKENGNYRGLWRLYRDYIGAMRKREREVYIYIYARYLLGSCAFRFYLLF